MRSAPENVNHGENKLLSKQYLLCVFQTSHERKGLALSVLIFIETCAKGELTNILKTINGAAGFVRTRSGDITPMKDSEVRSILHEQEVSDNLDMTNIFVMEEEVEITDGPFSSFKGKIVKIDTDKERVSVQVSIFGRPTNVDLTYLQIKKI